jgi:chitinase
MTYDFTSGSWGVNITGHNSNPYANPADPLFINRYSAIASVKSYINAGCTPKKINLGVAFYGRGFAIDPKYAGPASPFVPAVGGLTYGTWETNVFDYYEIKAKYMGTNQQYVYWDDVAKAPYIFNKALNQFISYEDQRSIAAKIDLVDKLGLGGLFAWEISSDTDDYELVKAMRGL